MMRLSCAAILLPAVLLLLTACGEDQPAPAGIARSTVTARPLTTGAAATTATPEAPTRTPGPPRTAQPLVGVPTEVDEALSAATGEDAAQIAGVMDALIDGCTDERAALGEAAEQTWRILNEQRDLSVPVIAILGRVLASLPLDGREVACETLFASVVTELSR